MEYLKRQSLAALLQSSYMTAGDLENSAWIVSHTDLKKKWVHFHFWVKFSRLTLGELSQLKTHPPMFCTRNNNKKKNILNKHLHIVWSLTNIREQWT